MYLIDARNVSDALLIGLRGVLELGKQKDSRVGPVKVFDSPVSTLYQKPRERVLFFPQRDANPFFHFMEGLWMIAGRNDVEWISRFNSSIAKYSDDGKTFHGAYGYRWRKHFGFDQIDLIIDQLKANPDDRRIVLQMWDPRVDLGRAGKDFPCNTAIKFRIDDGNLDMTVENRSNDMIWGAYGANAVHFSMLQEYMASCIGVEVGNYWQVSTNFHAYEETFKKHESLLDEVPEQSPYHLGDVTPFPMMNTSPDVWDRELSMFMSEGDSVMGYTDIFFKKVAVPILQSHKHFKEKEYDRALMKIQNCVAEDWKLAIEEYIYRRIK